MLLAMNAAASSPPRPAEPQTCQAAAANAVQAWSVSVARLRSVSLADRGARRTHENDERNATFQLPPRTHGHAAHSPQAVGRRCAHDARSCDRAIGADSIVIRSQVDEPEAIVIDRRTHDLSFRSELLLLLLLLL